MKIGRRKRNIILTTVLCVIILAAWTIWGNTALMVNAVTVSSSRILAAFSGFRIAASPQYDTLKSGLEAAWQRKRLHRANGRSWKSCGLTIFIWRVFL